MAKTKNQKQNIIQDISEKLKQSKSVVFADYQGLSMKQLSDLRNVLKNENSEFIITKNTLLEIALKESNLENKDILKLIGPTATLFSYEDEISPLKLLVKALKEAQLGSIKSGFLNSLYLEGDQIEQLSKLPNKQQLHAQVVGAISSPLYGIVNVLQGNIRNLVYVMSQIKEQKVN